MPQAQVLLSRFLLVRRVEREQVVYVFVRAFRWLEGKRGALGKRTNSNSSNRSCAQATWPLDVAALFAAQRPLKIVKGMWYSRVHTHTHSHTHAHRCIHTDTDMFTFIWHRSTRLYRQPGEQQLLQRCKRRVSFFKARQENALK